MAVVADRAKRNTGVPAWHLRSVLIALKAGGIDALVFPTRVTEGEPPKADARLYQLLEPLVEREGRQYASASGFAERVRRALVERMPSGDISLKAIARRLATSPRTLRRRLLEEDASFTDLLEAVRRDLARDYLADETRSVAEIAYLLGHAQPSAFANAFRRWTGSTPAPSFARLAPATPLPRGSRPGSGPAGPCLV